ncbi:MAG: SCP2 sterol-binding domain-containing protein [Pikeienuella sp.]
MSVETLAETIRARVAESDFDSVIKFDCGDDGILVIDNQTVSTADQEADCTVTVSLEDLASIIAGETDPTSAYMQGMLTVDGDMAVAMKLNQIL